MTSLQGWGFSDAERSEFWRRWRAGQTLTLIGEALGKRASSVYVFAARHGGVAPRQRRRSARSLCLGEREEISRGIAAHLSIRQIATKLRRAPPTNSPANKGPGRPRHHPAGPAHRIPGERARRPRPRRPALDAAPHPA